MTAKVKPARKGKTLAVLEKAAMRWYRLNQSYNLGYTNSWARVHQAQQDAYDAIAAHTASKKRKGTK
jgi:hypothetical protein